MLKYRQQLESYIQCVQHFCLDPDYETFHTLRQNTRLKMELGEKYDVWENAVLATYGPHWEKMGIASTDLRLTMAQERYETDAKRIHARLIVNPTGKIIDQSWYLFFATGKMQFMRDAFEVAGDEKVMRAIREETLKAFETIRDSYREKTAALLAKDPQHFAQHPLSALIEPNQRVFDDFQKILDDNTRRLQEMEDEQDSEILQLAQAVKQVNVQREEEKPKTPQDLAKEEQRKKEKAAAELFDKLSKDLLRVK